MTMAIARFRIAEPDKMEATLTVTMTIEDWRKVRTALDKGKDGWYGPERAFIESVDGVLSQVDQTFYAQASTPA
jgi:hypothetical protein